MKLTYLAQIVGPYTYYSFYCNFFPSGKNKFIKKTSNKSSYSLILAISKAEILTSAQTQAFLLVQIFVLAFIKSFIFKLYQQLIYGHCQIAKIGN